MTPHEVREFAADLGVRPEAAALDLMPDDGALSLLRELYRGVVEAVSEMSPERGAYALAEVMRGGSVREPPLATVKIAKMIIGTT